MSKSERIQLGEIYREHGVRGYCKAYIFSLTDLNLNEGQSYELRATDGNKRRAKLVEISTFGRYFLLKFDCFNTPESLLSWRKAGIWIAQEDLERTDSDDLYDFEWVGYTIQVDGQVIGTVDRIESNPLRQFVVKLGDKEVYVPCRKEWIQKLDKEAKVVTMDLPEGLLELE